MSDSPAGAPGNASDETKGEGRRILTLGYSPCPNDTFIFHALVHQEIECGLAFRERLEDVETLNRLALASTLDVSKVSYHLLGHVLDDYLLLRSGGALGRGCGPLVVAKPGVELSSLREKPVALPGEFTTAALLLRLYDPSLENLVYLPFEKIMGAVADGSVAAGVIIHESRFTYQGYGLQQLLDLGQWWEEDTGYPIPLGGIIARRSLGRDTLLALERGIAESVRHATAHPDGARPYIRAHSQEMSEEVCSAHIALYVNRFSVDLGREGEEAVAFLLRRAAAEGIIPGRSASLFIE
ncbi:1,4-dihydroxy-6-naphthoate synthase [Geomonas sp. RF6]|uniref:1,4-dihydroxy-6-naphthoate synthase n=1 Tax=Geomonas sp. RF6 TaxID=2897342 RepID=UPI001E2CDB60|nr:1,4-dihydroxy-6-naphthoate synthase [Geomonas sp. RF6]UFS71591.1 1,4-dihydroxy-6-naphthoate synthase [Geomonas sp. RF6]